MENRRSIIWLSTIFMIMCLVMTAGPAAFAEEEVLPDLCGEWVYIYIPDETVIILREDGTAVYSGNEMQWENIGTAIRLIASSGQACDLRYETLDDGQLIVYFPAYFERISEIGAEGEVIGTWVAPGGSQSSFVFTENGKFLEDGVFTGDYIVDAEKGMIALQYGGLFDDTDIYYSFSGTYLVIEYPQILKRK
ncbi:MAG: hypothetical protein CW338_08970 [Clostridiales bacterium]|nr:hypothetical protein [Clostridiales bacterium]